jgi:hypothetical protein
LGILIGFCCVELRPDLIHLGVFMPFFTTLSPELVRNLDQVADIYTPLLLAIAIMDLAFRWRNGDKLHCVKLLYATFVVYGWMFVDNRLQLWLNLGLDYSTHTAAALALVICIAVRKRLAVKAVLYASLILYGYLMSLLGYHSWLDMLSTASIIALCVLPMVLLRTRLASRVWSVA